MGPLTVFYSPTPANRQAVFHIQQIDRYKDRLHFVPLSSLSGKRELDLGMIAGRAAYLWGDGFAHHESQWFTRSTHGGLVKVKALIDQHDDLADFDAVPRDSPTYADHMLFAWKDGIKVVTPKLASMCAINHIVYDESTPSQSLDKIRTAAAGMILNQIALSIDCDGIIGFPADLTWVPRKCDTVELFNPKDVISLVAELGDKICRFDIGGLADTIPDFAFTGSRNGVVPKFDALPSIKEVLDFLSSEAFSRSANGMKALVDKVGTYVVEFYAEALLAFARSG